jgi:hypothetical protein
VPDATRRKHLEEARQLSLSLVYWLQTVAPCAYGGVGYKGVRLRKDLAGTEEGLAKYPYIRESRPILADLRIPEEHCGLEARAKYLGKREDEVEAEAAPSVVPNADSGERSPIAHSHSLKLSVRFAKSCGCSKLTVCCRSVASGVLAQRCPPDLNQQARGTYVRSD